MIDNISKIKVILNSVRRIVLYIIGIIFLVTSVINNTWGKMGLPIKLGIVLFILLCIRGISTAIFSIIQLKDKTVDTSDNIEDIVDVAQEDV